MATRSLIGIVEGNSVKYIYCHFDGYPSGVGVTLNEHYTDTNKIMNLISLGDISSLTDRLPSKDFMALASMVREAFCGDRAIVNNMIENALKGTTKPYGIWRGETEVEAKTVTLESYLSKPTQENPTMHGEEYRYLWIGGQWLCISSYEEETI